MDDQHTPPIGAGGAPDRDLENLRLLATFHWVVAALAAICALCPLFPLVIGISLLTGRFPDGQSELPMAEWMGWFFILFSTLWIVCGLTFSICLASAGRSLSRLRHHKFCLVMAGLACMFVPFGTVLGVFTIMLLT